MKNTTTFQKAGLILGSIFLALIILEFGVRLIRGKILDTSLLSLAYSPTEKEKQDPRAQYDELLGWVPNYGTRMSGQIGRLPGQSTYTIVDGNIRSNGKDRLKMFGGKTILAVGDSFTYGYDVNNHETWPAHLENLLVNRVTGGSLGNYKVINAGVSGYGLDQIILRGEQLVHKFKPHLMIGNWLSFSQ